MEPGQLANPCWLVSFKAARPRTAAAPGCGALPGGWAACTPGILPHCTALQSALEPRAAAAHPLNCTPRSALLREGSRTRSTWQGSERGSTRLLASVQETGLGWAAACGLSLGSHHTWRVEPARAMSRGASGSMGLPGFHCGVGGGALVGCGHRAVRLMCGQGISGGSGDESRQALSVNSCNEYADAQSRQLLPANSCRSRAAAWCRSPAGRCRREPA